METRHFFLFLMLCLGVHRSSSEILKRQKRNWIIDSFSIREDYDGKFPYSLGKVEIEKNFTFFHIHGQGVDETPKGILQIDPNTGELTVHKSIDYEEYQVLKLTFQAKDRANHVVDTQLGIYVNIVDANDNAPKFDHEKYEVTFQESTVQGTALCTVRAIDKDSNDNNRLFDFRISSVVPQPKELEFYIKQMDSVGTISFKGCLNREVADKYTITVEAKDRGEVKQLSSQSYVIINIEDGNNHLPVITGQQGAARVKEGQENVLVSRLQVEDKDVHGTAAWRAKFHIEGDENSNFKITTDPDTNEGLLYVEKYLDYELTTEKKLTIIVDNEIPFQMCKVVSRSSSTTTTTTTELWKVTTIRASGSAIGGTTGTAYSLSRHEVTVNVEDVNDSPIFDVSSKQVTVVENIKIGHHLEVFTARDPDINSANTVVYRKGEDVANWIKVDAKTGTITTTKIIDRESSFVVNSIYNVTILAIDDGQPPMTGTATLVIHIRDENDNTPSLNVNAIDMCDSDGISLANLTATDPDQDPYSGPFTFTLHGDVKGKWKLDPVRGHSVKLVKEKMVHSGHYELMLEVSDNQDSSAVHNLSVTVCGCTDPARPANCRIRKSTGSTVGGGAIGIVFFCMLLLAALLFLVFLLTCKKDSIVMPDGDSGQHLMSSNIEKPGTDCKVAVEPSNPKGYIQTKEQIQVQSKGQATQQATNVAISKAQAEYTMYQTELQRQQMEYWKKMQSTSTVEQHFARGNATYRSLGATKQTRQHLRNSMRVRGTWGGHGGRYSQMENSVQRTVMLSSLNKMMRIIEAPGEELGHYAPHVYAVEGDNKANSELDAISISEDSFDPELDLDLDYNFKTLASICMPSESTVYSTTLPSETVETTTWIQKEHSFVQRQNQNQSQSQSQSQSQEYFINPQGEIRVINQSSMGINWSESSIINS